MVRPMLAVDEAERRGDVETALSVIGAHPDDGSGGTFWRPWRVRRLTQLFAFGELCPGWVTSRWLLTQAADSWDTADRWASARALAVAIELRGGHDALPGVDETDAVCRVMDRDWVFRQLVVFEYGGLATYLRRVPADVLVGADSIGAWAAAPMGAYRLETRAPAAVRWTDLSTGEEFDVPNLGCAALVTPGETVLARRVPIEGGSMFESEPLVVPEPVAEAVAADPGEWLAVFRKHGVEGVALSREVSEMLIDVPHDIWTYALLRAEASQAPVTPRDAVPRLARGLLNLGVQALAGEGCGPEEVDPWPCVAAGLCTPAVFAALVELAGPEDRVTFESLAAQLAEPAASLARHVADGLRHAA